MIHNLISSVSFVLSLRCAVASALDNYIATVNNLFFLSFFGGSLEDPWQNFRFFV